MPTPICHDCGKRAHYVVAECATTGAEPRSEYTCRAHLTFTVDSLADGADESVTVTTLIGFMEDDPMLPGEPERDDADPGVEYEQDEDDRCNCKANNVLRCRHLGM